MSSPEAVTIASQTGKRSITDHFHRLNSVLPDSQEIVSVPPEMKASDAIGLLSQHGFSQLPVMINGNVIGVFSYRSFAQKLVRLAAEGKNKKLDPQEVFVEEVMEDDVRFARVSDELRTLFDTIDERDAVLVGDPNRLRGIVTAMDMLRYFYAVASPFVLIAEVELCLRALIRTAMNETTLIECAKTCLKHYPPEKLPGRLEDMTFNDYVQLVGDGRCWEHFQPTIGGNRERTRAKLEQLRDLRNDVFHFRREITVQDYEALSALRDWMLQKATIAEARLKGVDQ